MCNLFEDILYLCALKLSSFVFIVRCSAVIAEMSFVYIQSILYVVCFFSFIVFFSLCPSQFFLLYQFHNYNKTGVIKVGRLLLLRYCSVYQTKIRTTEVVERIC